MTLARKMTGLITMAMLNGCGTDNLISAPLVKDPVQAKSVAQFSGCSDEDAPLAGPAAPSCLMASTVGLARNDYTARLGEFYAFIPGKDGSAPSLVFLGRIPSLGKTIPDSTSSTIYSTYLTGKVGATLYFNIGNIAFDDSTNYKLVESESSRQTLESTTELADSQQAFLKDNQDWIKTLAPSELFFTNGFSVVTVAATAMVKMDEKADIAPGEVKLGEEVYLESNQAESGEVLLLSLEKLAYH